MKDKLPLGQRSHSDDETGTAGLTKAPVESGTTEMERSAGRSDQTAIEQGNAAEEHDQIKFHRPTEPDSGLMTEK
jgi:hypothetical protein